MVAAFERGHRAGLERRVRRGEGKGAPDDLRAVRRGEVARERQPRRQVDAAHERVVAQVGELAPPQHEGLAHQLEQAAARHRPDRARRAAPARAAGAALERVQHPRADRDQVVAEHARRQRRLLAVRAREAERALADAASEIARAAARAGGGAVARHRVILPVAACDEAATPRVLTCGSARRGVVVARMCRLTLFTPHTMVPRRRVCAPARELSSRYYCKSAMFDIDAALSAAAGARPLAQSYGALASRVQQGVLCVCPANDRGLTTALNWAAHAHVRGMRPVIGLDGPLPAATAAAPSSAVAFFQLPTAAEAIDAVANATGMQLPSRSRRLPRADSGYEFWLLCGSAHAAARAPAGGGQSALRLGRRVAPRPAPVDPRRRFAPPVARRDHLLRQLGVR